MGFQPEKIEDFLGKGIKYPIELVDGKVPISSGPDLVKSGIKICTSWPINTRFFLCEFGSRITSILEENNDTKLRSLLRSFFIDSVKLWEPRVEEIDVSFEDITMTKIIVRVDYRIINAIKPETFIFPFYRNITS